ncbi:MAG: NTP transferase domain-containing protein [Opitutae bacterium]|nr:NTP transferase domain-containing protein [Opitutae bacterium]
MSDPDVGNVRVVLLAGGFGTRVRHLLPDVPKPMAAVCGRPFVEWIVRFFHRHGLADFTLSTGHLAEVVAAHFAGQPVAGATVRCCAETTPLGTAGGFLNCVDPQAQDDTLWLVANGDSLVFADPRPAVTMVRSGRADAALLGLALPDVSRYGSLDIADDGTLRAFREKRPGAGVINAGVYVFSQAAVRRMPPQRPLSFEFDVFPPLAAAGRVAAHTVAAPFLDIGTPETLAVAEDFIARNRAQFQCA